MGIKLPLLDTLSGGNSVSRVQPSVVDPFSSFHSKRDFRMLFFPIAVMVAVACTVSALADFQDGSKVQLTRSPSVEVLMHLPPVFSNLESFKTFLGMKPERRRRDLQAILRYKREALTNQASLETNSPNEKIFKEINNEPSLQLYKTGPSLETLSLPPERTVVDSGKLIVAPSKDSSNFELLSSPDISIELENPYTEVKSEEGDQRKRRNTSANDHEDKRSYPEPGTNQDSTTIPPFWKPKKIPPPFVTTREGRQGYDQPQHRENDNGRESHSMKESKPISSNEIPRIGDSYYSASNGASARVYNTRQSELPAPKSVYDSIDYTNRRPQGRNLDARGRLSADPFGVRSYDRYYYPLGSEVAGRGVEYYHRSLDPSTGRIIYYASLPEPEAYRASRTYTYDAYGRSFPPYPAYQGYSYQPYYPINPYVPYQPYSTPAQDFSRSARYQTSRFDDVKNKTYIIYDADEKRSLAYATKNIDDRNRFAPPLPYPSFPIAPTYQTYQPFPAYTPYTSQVSGYNSYSRNGYYDQRDISRQVELPLTTRSALKPVNV